MTPEKHPCGGEQALRDLLAKANVGTEVIERDDGIVFIRKDVVLKAMSMLVALAAALSPKGGT